MFFERVTSDSYKIYWRLLFGLILVTLLFLTLSPQPPKPIDIKNIDKIYHFLAFAGFTFVFKMSFIKLSRSRIVFSAVTLGLSIEIAQYFIPGRGLSLADMIANALGVFIGAFISCYLVNRSKEKD